MIGTQMPPLGLIAGEGVFPVLVARGARAAGRKVVCVGFTGSVWPSMRDEVDVFKTASVTRLNSWMKFLRRHGCNEAIMVGRVTKGIAHNPLWFVQHIPDLRMIRVFFSIIRRDRRPQTILDAAIRELAAEGLTLIDSTTYCADQLTTPGVLTRRQPTAWQWEDVHYGWATCQQISRMDIGQAIAVQNKTIVAVEALEGTNAMIERAGKLCRGPWTFIKVANTHQDMRADVPTVGVTTIQKLAAAGAGCVVLEVAKTIILEKQKVLELADRHKIAVVGYDVTALGAASAGASDSVGDRQ